MPDLKEIFYPCKIDRSMQPAQFLPASGSEPRPMVVCLHTWSCDHRSDCKRFTELAAL